jgi:hypothetical protein
MLRIVLKIVVCLLLAGGSLFWALSSMKAILSYRPVLDLTPPPPGEALGGNPDGRVVFVLIDGLRVDTAADSAVMPVLASSKAPAPLCTHALRLYPPPAMGFC